MNREIKTIMAQLNKAFFNSVWAYGRIEKLSPRRHHFKNQALENIRAAIEQLEEAVNVVNEYEHDDPFKEPHG